MKLRPSQWLLYAPIAVLPFLAALVLEGPGLRGELARQGGGGGILFVATYHWLWMLVALGLGLWTGWYTAANRKD